MKKTVILLCLALMAASCHRETPQPVGSFTVTCTMPAECLPQASYAGHSVAFKGGLTSYTFQTGADGRLEVSGMAPGIYDIITSIELSGAEYKLLLKDPTAVRDKDRVVLGCSLMQQQIFEARDLELALNAAVLKGLLISKVYYAGTKDDMGRDYTTDAYLEIFNNSDEVQYLDGKYLGLADATNPSSDGFPVSEHPDSIYTRQICRFPGAGTEHPIQPGGSVLIAARSARNHQESAATSVDLSHADFEVKTMAGSGNPDVPMLEIISNSSKSIQYLNLNNGLCNAVILFETEENVLTDWPERKKPGKNSAEMFRPVPKNTVLDGVECLKYYVNLGGPNLEDKRLQGSIDIGYINITATNGKNHESVDRKVSRFQNNRYYLVDTNNSTNDFAVCTDPTPQKYDKEGLQ